MPPLESSVVRKIMTTLNKRGGFWVKIHGSAFQRIGIPDIIGCYYGLFIAFEVKRSAKEQPSLIQRYIMKKIVRAGGIARTIHSIEEAETLLDRVEYSRRPRASDQQ